MSPAKTPPAAGTQRLVSVTLDEHSIGRSSPDIDHEREVAIYDLLEMNSFAPVGHDDGPYALHLSVNGNRLVFDIRLQDGSPVMAHLFSLSPLRRIVKDYYMICDSYYAAIRTATPDRIEANAVSYTHLDVYKRQRRKRSAITSPVPTTCCRPRARRGSRPD